MSTQTKIKGILVNDDLPILTSDGLVNKTYVDYVEALAAVDYTMNATQRAAVNAFVSGLAEYGLGEYIMTMFPFIGSASKRSAIRVPLFGTTEYGNIGNSWSGAVVSGSDVLGINQDYTDGNTKLSGFVPNKNFVGVAASFIKKNTSEAGEYTDRILCVSSNKLHLRLSKTSGGAERAQLYYVQDASSNLSGIPAPEGISAAGAGFVAGMFRNPAGYARYFEFGGGVVYDGSEIDEYRPPRYTDSDLDASMSSVGACTQVDAWTSITTFKKLMNKEQLQQYMTLLKSFMHALGRD